MDNKSFDRKKGVQTFYGKKEKKQKPVRKIWKSPLMKYVNVA